jgi:hypothetical protein
MDKGRTTFHRRVILIMRSLIRHLLSLFRRPNVRFGLMMDGVKGKRTPVRSAQFVGFLQGSGFRPSYNPARQEKAMRRRRLVVHLLVASLFLGFVWVMMESAHALSLF